jgi:hypothetical protein
MDCIPFENRPETSFFRFSDSSYGESTRVRLDVVYVKLSLISMVRTTYCRLVT